MALDTPKQPFFCTENHVGMGVCVETSVAGFSDRSLRPLCCTDGPFVSSDHDFVRLLSAQPQPFPLLLTRLLRRQSEALALLLACALTLRRLGLAPQPVPPRGTLLRAFGAP